MGTYTIQTYHKVWKARAKNIKKNSIKTLAEAANFMLASCRSLVPKKTGETIRGLKKIKEKNGYLVESRVKPKSKGFMQNYWTNQQAPWRTIYPWWNKGKPTIYGDGSHRITGTPRWFHFATLRTRAILPKNMRNAVLDGLRKG